MKYTEEEIEFLDKCAISAMSKSMQSKFLTKSNIIMISKESFMLAEEMLEVRKKTINDTGIDKSKPYHVITTN